jgi:hypothetical protein
MRMGKGARRHAEVRVRSWNQLLDQLFTDAWRPEIGRFRSNYAFRGLPRHDGGALVTGLARLGGARLEGHLLRNFRKYAPRASVPRESIWNWLALAQHHGLPTRLLDWTYSPLVALHFVTDALDAFGDDGVVLAVDFVRVAAHLPPRLERRLAAEGSNVFTAEMLDDVARSLPEIERLSADPFVLFLEPPSLDDRIVNQFALFSVMSSARARLDQWLEARPDLWRRVVVPAALKLEIRDKLDQANLTERVLFPGLDGLSRWLRRQYSSVGLSTSRGADTEELADPEGGRGGRSADQQHARPAAQRPAPGEQADGRAQPEQRRRGQRHRAEQRRPAARDQKRRQRHQRPGRERQERKQRRSPR